MSVLVPWFGNCPHRIAAWRTVQRWLGQRHPDYQVVTGTSASGRKWCKAQAVAEAAAQATGEIFVVLDADCIAPQLTEAVQYVKRGHAWAMPHYTVNRLNRSATALVVNGGDPAKIPTIRKWYDQLPYVGFPGGGATVLHRNVYASVPLDPGFLGWGQEDEAWAQALRALHGKPWRPRKAPLYHLWHPPQSRASRSTGSVASRDLLREYRRRHRRDEMIHLLEEPRRFYRDIASRRTST